METDRLTPIGGAADGLEAVLEDVRRAGVDAIVVGGDVVPGPMPCETIARLLSIELPVHFIHGNGELAVLAQIDAAGEAPATYWPCSRAPARTWSSAATRICSSIGSLRAFES